MQFTLHPATDGFPDVKRSDWNSRSLPIRAFSQGFCALWLATNCVLYNNNNNNDTDIIVIGIWYSLFTSTGLFYVLYSTLMYHKNCKKSLKILFLNPITVGVDVFHPPPPLWFFLNNLKTADIRTLKLLHFLSS